jgi:hypothetical protein
MTSLLDATCHAPGALASKGPTGGFTVCALCQHAGTIAKTTCTNKLVNASNLMHTVD